MSRYTRSGIPIKDYYSLDDIPADNNPNPGEFPYTRGRRSKSKTTGGWIHRELSGEGDPVKSNEQIKYLLSKGQTGIDVIADSPTQGFLDPDHPLAKFSTGTQGVSLCYKNDFLELFKDIPLDNITVSQSMPPLIAIVNLVIAAKHANIPIELLRGSLIHVPLYYEDCSYATNLPLDLRLRIAADCIEFCTLYMPKFHSYIEDTYVISEGGLVTAIEEMALGFVQIRYIVNEMLRRGFNIDSFAPRIAILVNCSMDFFEEIAKIRAVRKLFAKMMKEEYGAKDPRSWSAVITCHTSGISLTAQQPVNNIVRGSIQALSLVLAGVNAIEISTFDEAYRTPSPEGHRIGLRTQQIIELESGVSKVVDPLGGSYYLEYLTTELQERIWAMVKDIESKGDPAVLSNDGYFRGIFKGAMERYQNKLRSGELRIVGVNMHKMPIEEDTLLKEYAEKKIEPYLDRIKQIKHFKANRDTVQLQKALRRVYNKTMNPNENLVLCAEEAIEAGATFEEIVGTMRMAYGWPYDFSGINRVPVEGVIK